MADCASTRHRVAAAVIGTIFLGRRTTVRFPVGISRLPRPPCALLNGARFLHASADEASRQDRLAGYLVVYLSEISTTRFSDIAAECRTARTARCAGGHATHLSAPGI